MSNGVLPKTQASKSSLKSNELSEDAKVQISNSDFSFELKPKPKLTCIPENCSKFLSDLREPLCRKTQSLNVSKKAEVPEKSWSVLFIGSKSNLHAKNLIM
ncbi:uncharacterized protein LOC105664763 isoform X1 [Ceratitis capitata]|uniref:Uncharacterized protein n=1 Tax=Ceratitis capitata TaxID=7213 RepID=W8C239_CERCA|nr:uncharacterized protein LOC105664763 isoform X1 [Ceratitis capitata]XP_012156387.1 uncharacterized protein LOC105664763 isoform X1 [Ceratitis capitata]XP_012156388.1 uncharacterized protein LOC105664763 isoform X1 [Ceratitis capitata]XP_012156389.1 uncharacterized protein LOC105664763 isoform X1 [Ceratitis capitata]XP_012156390.1 uncharacterized protein LOC105664763 isoform X1 [Ceratitis capitata]XP_012156391.1 uncharacterized protein LOC105664763 isoform X1 [Ceratitis capitata]